MSDLTSEQNPGSALERLKEWEISGMGLHPGGSNYVFVVKLEDPELERIEAGSASVPTDDENAVFAIYKPAKGERPLRDFPYGTLHKRERAAYLLATELGWPDIPPTVIREGPHGEGSVQLFIDADPEANYFTMRDDCLHLFEPVAMFDVLVQNADRKGGACLKAESDGKVWAIDHGLTFNPFARRRTVMFEFNGSEYSSQRLDDIKRVVEQLDGPASDFSDEMKSLLGESEIAGLVRRSQRMIESKKFPLLDPDVNVPWPFI